MDYTLIPANLGWNRGETSARAISALDLCSGVKKIKERDVAKF